MVAAGGNGFEQGNPVNYPAASPGVLGVASVGQRTDGASVGKSPFSNTGAYIDIAAPGEQIASTIPGNQWVYKSGTSMAAPFVSAGAALVRAANPTFTKDQVDDALQSTAWDDGSGNGRDDVYGWGLLQADAAALKAAYAPGGLTPDSDGDGVPDATDPCPSVAGPVGGTGCPPPPPDADGDGLADAQDPCPAVAGPGRRHRLPRGFRW